MRTIRRHSVYRHFPRWSVRRIAIITASSDKMILEEMKDSGVKTILRKPRSVDELTDLINKYRDL